MYLTFGALMRKLHILKGIMRMSIRQQVSPIDVWLGA